MKRPFFSIVIPAYNSRQYIGELLDSIAKNYCLNEMEVIIVDDKSTESYIDIVDKYNQLNILYVENEEHKGVPVFGRQKGANLAKGEWLTFADHDDTFEPHVFDRMKETIETGKLDTYIITSVNIVGPDGEIEKDINPMNWTHGKFYNMDNFWKKYDMHYDLSLNYSEDIYLSIQAYFKCICNNIQFITVDAFTYNFNQRSTSLSHQETFYKSSMCDYIKSVIEQNLYFWKEYPDYHDAMEVEMYSGWYHFYFHIQSMIYNYIDPSDALLLLSDYFEKTLTALGVSSDEFIRKTEDDYYYQYCKDRDIVLKVFEFIERMSFYDFINYLPTVKNLDKDSIANQLFYSQKGAVSK